MNIAFSILLALGLSMDAFAVSVSCGLCIIKGRFKNAARVGFLFGFFQWGMIILGWLAGLTFRDFIEPVDHWIAFFLLFFIGVKMWRESKQEGKRPIDLTDTKLILTLSLATSIDALAAGISLSTLGYNIFIPSLFVGIVTLILSSTGVLLGCWMNQYQRLKKYLDKLGAIILISIGLKILYEHILK